MSLPDKLRWSASIHHAEGKPFPLLTEAATELDRLTARVAELEANAGRYQWLRRWLTTSTGLDRNARMSGVTLDAAIDKAMGAAGQQGFGNAR